MYYEADKNQQNANCVYICLRFILPFVFFFIEWNEKPKLAAATFEWMDFHCLFINWTNAHCVYG